jgi:hypothetical protein
VLTKAGYSTKVIELVLQMSNAPSLYQHPTNVWTSVIPEAA